MRSECRIQTVHCLTVESIHIFRVRGVFAHRSIPIKCNLLRILDSLNAKTTIPDPIAIVFQSYHQTFHQDQPHPQPLVATEIYHRSKHVAITISLTVPKQVAGLTEIFPQLPRQPKHARCKNSSKNVEDIHNTITLCIDFGSRQTWRYCAVARIVCEYLMQRW